MSQVTLYNLTESEISEIIDRYGVELASSRGNEHTFVGDPDDVEALYNDTRIAA